VSRVPDSLQTGRAPRASRTFSYPFYAAPKTPSWTELTSATGTDRKEQPFGCPYCPSRFSRADLINRHIRRFHPDAQLVDPPKRRKRVDNSGAHINANECRAVSARPSLDHNTVSDVPSHHDCTLVASGANLLPPPANMSQVQDSPSCDLSLAFPLLFSTEMSNVRGELAPAKSFEMDASDVPVERTNSVYDSLPQCFRDMTPLTSNEHFNLGSSAYAPKEICKQQLDDLQLRTSMLKRFRFLDQFNLPTTNKIEYYLTAFFKYFIPRSPIVHVESFRFESCSRTSSMSFVYSDVSANVILNLIDWRTLRQ